MKEIQTSISVLRHFSQVFSSLLSMHFCENEWWINCATLPTVSHNPISAKSIGLKDRTWKNLTVQASPWYVVSCSVGLDFPKLQNFLAIGSKGEPQWKNDFTGVPPLVHKAKKFCSFWRSRPLEHVSTFYGEAWTVKVFHVLCFDPIDFAEIGAWGIYIFYN